MGNDAIDNKVANDVSLIQRNTQSLKDSFKDFKPKEFEKLEGLSKPEDKGLEALGKDILDKLNIIVKSIDPENPKNNKEDTVSSLKNGLSSIFDAATEGAGVDADEENDKSPLSALKKGKDGKTPTSKVDIKDLKVLSESNGLGFAVLYWKLDEISKKIDGDDKKKKGGGLGKFFSGLIEGAAGIGLIAVALMAFAGALVLFQFIDWLPAIAGLGLFAIFTIGILEIAKKIGKEKKSFLDFAEGATLLAGAIGIFAISLLIASHIFSGQPIKVLFFTLPPINVLGAILALVAFGAFVVGMAGLSKLVGENGKSFTEFAKGSVVMTLALVTFAISLLVTSYIFSGKPILFLPPMSVGGAIAGILTFGVFMVGMVALAKFAGKAGNDFKQFALASLLMAAALVTFALGMAMVAVICAGSGGLVGIFYIPKIPGGGFAALGGLVLVTSFLVGMMAIAYVGSSAIGPFSLLAVATLLMGAALFPLALSMAMIAVICAGSGGMVGLVYIPKIPGGGFAALGGLGIATAFIVAFGALAIAVLPIAPLVLAGMPILMLISGAIYLIARALSAAAAVIGGGQIADEEGKERTIKGIDQKGVKLFFTTFNYFILEFAELAKGFGTLLKATAAATVLIPTAVCIGQIADALIASATATQQIDDLGGPERITGVFDAFHEMVLKLKDLGFAELVKVVAKAKVLNPTAECIGNIANTLIEAAKASQEVQDNGGIKNVLVLFSKEDGFLRVVDELVQVTSTMDKEGAKVFEIVSRSMVPITDAINGLVAIIDDAARFAPGQPDADKIPLANASINRLMLGDDGKSGFVAIFNNIAAGVQSVSGYALSVLPQLKNVTDAIVSLVNVITTTSEIDQGQIESGLSKVQGVTNFIVDTAVQFNSVKSVLKDKAMKKNVDLLEGRDDYEGSGVRDMLNSLKTTASEISNINLSGNEMGNASGIVNIINSFSRLKKDAIGSFSKLGKDLNSFTAKDFSKTNNSLDGLKTALEKISTITTQANPFNILKDSIIGENGAKKAIDDLNEALKTTIERLNEVAKDSGGMQKSMNKMGRKSFSLVNINSNSSSEGSDTIESILTEWNKNGVPVKANNTAAVNAKKQVQEVAFSI